MDKCYDCRLETEWKNHYIEAVKRFDIYMKRTMAVTMIAVILMLICIIITALSTMCVIKFINSFEYVEETTYSIEQDEGINTAIVGGENNEVKYYGTEDN
ncbi:MAG: hypothetical protein J6Y71_08375 [Ruminococcus sp.]|nr:hypothetical protein [Ruminococcus sp.]